MIAIPEGFDNGQCGIGSKTDVLESPPHLYSFEPSGMVQQGIHHAGIEGRFDQSGLPAMPPIQEQTDQPPALAQYTGATAGNQLSEKIAEYHPLWPSIIS